MVYILQRLILGELKRFFSFCKPVLIFCTNKTLDIILNLQSEEYTTSTVIVYDSPVNNSVTHFDTLLQNGDDNDNFTPVVLNDMEEVALILTSSGTTGFPKCVQLTHSNVRTLMLYAADPQIVDINQNECIIGLLPFFHIFGCGLTLAAILNGAKIVILEKFVPDKFLSLIQEYKATKLFAVPPILLFLVKSPLVKKYDISSIHDVLCGGAAVNKDLEKAVKNLLKVKDVRQIYGMTEVCGAATVNIKDSTKYGSAGKAVSTFQIKVSDPTNGKTLSANEFGELRFKGGGVMKGYLGNDEETLNAFDEDGFLKSGDLGYYDTEGFFYIVGRLKEIIKYKGFQVSPAELESLLIQHPAVKDAGVIGVPDERAGELPLAFIVKQNQDVTEDDIIRYVAENVSVQKHLHGGVRFVDAIPKNPSGKIIRTKLKNLL